MRIRFRNCALISVFILNSFAYADLSDDRLETNINDRMKNQSSIDQKKPVPIKDSAITREIKENLRSGKLSNFAKNIQVITANGHVTLKGRILSQQEEQLILQKTRSVSGVTMVLNEMQILPEN